MGNLVDVYMNPATVKEQQENEIKYVVRVIGMIDDESLAKMKKDKQLVKRIITSPTVTLDTISKNRSLDGHRIVGVIHSKNEKRENILNKLFITEKISSVQCMSKKYCKVSRVPIVKLTMIGHKGSFITMSDIE